MTDVVIKCPGCLARLRFRKTPSRTSVECPRCAEVIDVTATVAAELSPESAVPTETRRSDALESDAATGSASQPVANSAAEPPAKDYIDDDVRRVKREALWLLGLVAAATIAALIAVPSGLRHLMGSDDPQEVAAVDENQNQDAERESRHSQSDVRPRPNQDALPDATAAERHSKEGKTSEEATRPSNEAQNARAAAQAAVPDPGQPKDGSSHAAPHNQSGDNNLAAVPDTSATGRAGGGRSSGQVTGPRESPAEDKPGSVPPDAGADSGSQVAGLQYGWKKGAEHIYRLDISADHGNSVIQKISGTCTYKVTSSGRVPDQTHEGSGTGFVVSSDGIIVTCEHVVRGARSIEVMIADRSYSARVIAVNVEKDLAVIQVDQADLPTLRLGDSDSVQLAETVRAFGFPLSTVLGTGVKVASGGVAGIVMDPVHGRQIQTDAPINPGNSGGPLVNSMGHVIGVTSSKIASSAASSVGFAVPVNDLKEFLQAQGLSFVRGQNSDVLAGPELARQISPAVVYIRVTAAPPGKVYDLTYTATLTERQVIDPRRFQIGVFPSIPGVRHARGTVQVTEFGEIVEFTGEGSLPFVLGDVGRFFIEPLSAAGHGEWHEEAATELRVVRREQTNPLNRLRQGAPFGPRGRFDGAGPFGGQNEEKTVKTFPAIERTVYRTGSSLNGRTNIRKEYLFRTTDDEEKPFLSVAGTGDVVFDTKSGIVVRMDYKATFTQHGEDGRRKTLPVTVSYVLRDPEVVRKEREAALAKAEQQKKQQELERTTPNPELVDQLLQKVRAAGGSLSANIHLQRLARIAIVPKKRDTVLTVATNHLSNGSGFVQAAAAEAFAHWATQDNSDELWKIAASKNHLYRDARAAAIKRLVEMNVEGLWHRLVPLMEDFTFRHTLKPLFIKAGKEAEPAILDEFDVVKDRSARRDLVDILRDIGSEKSVPLLERLAQGSDISLKFAAKRALDAVRARQ